MKIEKAVKTETRKIALGTVVLSVFMHAVFLIIGKWDLSVLWGNILGGAASVLNFFLMALTVQSAVENEAKDAKSKMKTSLAWRNVMLIVAALVGAIFDIFNVFATLIPLLFPRIIILLSTLLNKNSEK